MTKQPKRSFLHAILAWSILFSLWSPLAGCGGKSYEKQDRYAGRLVKQYGGEKTRPDAAHEKRIVLLHPASGERLDIVYVKNGNYDPEALRAINRLFRDRTTDKSGAIDPELIDFLVDLRTRFHLPESVVFEILSGYRSPETNEALRQKNKQAAKESLHKYGYAVDFRIQGLRTPALAEIAKTMQRGGASYYPSDNHTHIDIGNIRTWAAK